MFDLAVRPPVAPPQFFSVADCLRQQLEAQQITQIFDEAAEIVPPPSETVSPTPPPSPMPPAAPSPPPSPAPIESRDTPHHLENTSTIHLDRLARKKFGSKRWKQEKREHEAAESSDPTLKAIHQERREATKKSALQSSVDAAHLPRTKPGWIGTLLAQSGTEAPPLESLPSLPPRLVEHSYTQDDIDCLVGATGFTYVPWSGDVTIPLLDSHWRTFGLLSSKPKDLEGWKTVTEGSARLMSSLFPQSHFTDADWYHHRAHQDAPYLSVSRGVSLGGGQQRLGELHNHPDNVAITDEMLLHVYFQRIVGFTNCLFQVFAPMLFLFYKTQMALIAAWDASLRWPFQHSVFAACTFNFGPRAITCPHLDFGNLAWGWCAITSLASFDPDCGGHLILWDLKLIIWFPAGATILIPSAILRHSNVPVQAHETHFSFVQYTAGGLFCWIKNGYMMDEAFEQTATQEEKECRAAEAKTRWEEGMNMFSIVDEL